MVTTPYQTDRDLFGGCERALESSGSRSALRQVDGCQGQRSRKARGGLIVSSSHVSLWVGYLAGGFAPENRQTGVRK